MKPTWHAGSLGAASWLRWLALACCLAAASGVRLNQNQKKGSKKYLLATFPDLKQVNYIRVPDPTWRPLVLDGLVRPTRIVVDPYRLRLFVIDETVTSVLWLQLSILPSGLLITDGRMHVVTPKMFARGLSVDEAGDLYVAGRYDPGPPVIPVEAVFKWSNFQLMLGAASNSLQQPTVVWTTKDSAATSPATAQLTAPSAITVDANYVYWGNDARPTPQSGSVVRAALNAPVEGAEDFAWVLSNNVDKVDALVLTAADVYYASGTQLFGVPKRKTKEMCGDGGASCPAILKSDGNPPTISAMVWDGEDTVFAADKTLSILQFASGTLNTHVATKVCDAPGISGLSLLMPLSAAPHRGASQALLLALAAVALVAGRAAL